MKIPVCVLIFLLTAIVSKAQPTLTQQPTNQIVNNGGAASFSVHRRRYRTFTYQWRLNGTNLPAPGIITTVAGGGVGGGGAATNAAVDFPSGVAMDGVGNLFIADHGNNRIRKVDANGVITTVAGNGTLGYSGDGGAAINAALYGPSGVALDGLGNLFIVDQNNQRIRKVSTNGIITTVAGNGTFGFSGDGGAATNAALKNPYDVAVDGVGNLFIADLGNNRVRKVGTNGTITTVAGGGGSLSDGIAATNATLNPKGVAVDGAGNLFIADSGNYRIRKVGTNGIIATVAGKGTFGFSGDGSAATDAALSRPSGIAVDGVGNLYIADTPNQRIRKVGMNGIITTVAGNGIFGFSGDGSAATNAALNNPQGVAVDGVGNVFIADRDNNRIRKVGTNGIIATVAGNGNQCFSGDGGAATNAALNDLFGVAVDGVGNLYIADTPNQRIRKVGMNGIITTVAGNGIFGFSGDGSAATNAALNNPQGVAVDGVGNVFIADRDNNRIRKVDSNGIITTIAGNGTYGFSGDGGAATNAALSRIYSVAVDGVGNLFIADLYNNRVRKVGTSGVITTVAGNGTNGFSGDGSAATNATLNYPQGVAVDGVGNLFIADGENNRIRKVGMNGIIATVVGNGTFGFSGDGSVATNATLNYPLGVAVDGDGNLFIADSDNNRIRKVGTSGIITTVVGNGTFGFSGDGSAATNATLNYPLGVAVDGDGNLFIADTFSRRIRKVTGPSSRLPVLVLSGVTASAAGDYDVVVSNSSGSVTSLVATLTVVSPLPLRFISPGLSNNQFNALLTGTIGGGYVIQVSSNLAVSSWSPIATGAIPPSGSIAITDAVSTSQSQKFYRAVSGP